MLYMEEGWLKELKEEFDKPYMYALSSFLKERLKLGATIYPPIDQIFNAFCLTPFEKVSVVIVGQDPYHGHRQAHGLSFSVPEGVALPPSLQNIFKELKEDLNIPAPKNGSLLPWAKQGVLLLNATLTVEEGVPKSHYGKGWELFTDAALKKLYEREDPLVFMLWGKSAKEKLGNVMTQKKSHLILTAAHPSPYSATSFFGCRHFSKANDFLIKNNKNAIDWCII